MLFFFFNDTATTEIYTLSLHDALPILDVDTLDSLVRDAKGARVHYGMVEVEPLIEHLRVVGQENRAVLTVDEEGDRKSTRLNSSHANISYAVFCLKKK